ncbi:Synaptogyrin-2 [Dufourea novaeangliae]|uniref:Synaptogyrin-2 n=1 Tax=Dufourea novaeangliae TaxID=178035 RepID=A0A154PHI4_DUFNO|nr:Synaptogyrin-2 [Dufourea novaeangliae]
MDNYCSPFSFTKQTASLLRGLGVPELIPECKKRNISTDTLHELTTEELIMLGADSKKAEEIRNALNIKGRRSGVVVTNIQDRLEHFLEIIKHGEQQLSLIQAFVSYCRLRLKKERINIFVNPNKSLSASEILPIAVNATLTELEEAKQNLYELEELILGMDGGAYGGGKAGAPFDPIAFVRRPQVILRAVCLVSYAIGKPTPNHISRRRFRESGEICYLILQLLAIIVFGCISNKGYIRRADGKEVCLYNEDHNACNYGIAIGVLAFLASIGFLVGEYLFEQMSSVKTRKHFVLLDLGFSGFWAFLYFVGFCYLTNAWNKSKTPENNYGVTNVESANACSFFSIFTWAACAWFAFQRFKQGTDAAFAPSYEADPVGGTGYTSYPDATDTGYQDPPFGQQQQQQQQQRMPDFQAPAY